VVIGGACGSVVSGGASVVVVSVGVVVIVVDGVGDRVVVDDCVVLDDGVLAGPPLPLARITRP
jgi:hypothetical protein